MRKQKRNLAFYKRSGEEWLWEEYVRVCEYAGEHINEDHQFIGEGTERKYIFDMGASYSFMYFWREQEAHENFKNCKQVAYEDVFKSDIEELGRTRPQQYRDGIDTFQRAEANMSIDGIMAATVITVDAYIWRNKGTDLEDFKKARDWLDWCIKCAEGH